jgi:hypothetical protein
VLHKKEQPYRGQLQLLLALGVVGGGHTKGTQIAGNRRKPAGVLVVARNANVCRHFSVTLQHAEQRLQWRPR